MTRVLVKANSYKRDGIQVSEHEHLFTSYYSSLDYQSRLEALEKLSQNSQNLILSDKFILDVLNDKCAQVRQYILEHFDFQEISKIIELKLTEMARNDEKVALRMLAIDTLAAVNPKAHYDLFFNSAMLKNNKESAAGLRGMLKVDLEKAYNMALFRIKSSTGELDLAITEVLLAKSSVQDLYACKKFLSARKKFFKNRYVPHYLLLVSELKHVALIQHHLEFICTSIQSEKNHTMTGMLVQQLYEFRNSINQPVHRLHHLSSDLVPILSESINKLLRFS